MNPIPYAKMPPVPNPGRRWPDRQLTSSPAWCAVDLRDGNQALPNPMNPVQKRRYFALLAEIGFKEIEVGFPAASQDDWDFCRALIEEELIPDDVTISVLTQARPALVERTMAAIAGARRAVVHFYVATSALHRRYVFGLNRDKVLNMAVAAATQIREAAAAQPGVEIGMEFSPEEFTDTELDFTVAICDAVGDAWGARPGHEVIFNLPATVERRLPNEYADMIELFIGQHKHAGGSVISVHCHNDMGMGVASTMQTLLAGAARVEGTLFGHGERTGNVDLVTVALNLDYLGIETGLDFSRLPEIARTVAEVTAIEPHPRQPYVGELVFTAFSGSHQDAIHKGLAGKERLIEDFDGWKIPYLHVDPARLGRKFERFIRINSQSGKGGIAHVLETDYRVTLPRWVQVDLRGYVQAYADHAGKELSGEEVWGIFRHAYVERPGPVQLLNYWPRPADHDPRVIQGELHLEVDGVPKVLKAEGNGPISAFVHALRLEPSVPDFQLDEYEEETRGRSADAEAICFVRLIRPSGGTAEIGVGFGSNIDQAAVAAVCSGVNALAKPPTTQEINACLA